MLENEFNTEKSKLQSQHIKEKSNIIGIINRMEQEYLEEEADSKHEHQSIRDDIRNKVNNKINKQQYIQSHLIIVF